MPDEEIEDADERARAAAGESPLPPEDAGQPGAAAAGGMRPAPGSLAIGPHLVASLLDITERRLQQLVAEGWIQRAERGQYNLRSAVQGYIKYLKQHSRDNTRGAETSRLARAQAVKVEMENFRRMGDLAVWGQVDDLLASFIQEVKAAHEGLPGRLSSELAAIHESPQIYLRLQTELRRVDDLLADYLEKRAESFETMQEPGLPDAPRTADDADGVGAEE